MRDINAQILVGIPKIQIRWASKQMHYKTVLKRTSVECKQDLWCCVKNQPLSASVTCLPAY